MEQGLLLLLVLPTGLVLLLNNCYYVPSLSSNIISLSYFDKQGFVCMNGNGTCRKEVDCGVGNKNLW